MIHFVPTRLNDLVVDVIISSPASGEVLSFNGSKWINSAAYARKDQSNTFTAGPQTVQTGADANKGVVVQANSASQTANYIEAQDSSGNARLFWSPAVAITGQDAGYIALQPGTREYRISTRDVAGSMHFSRSDSGNALVFIPESDHVLLKTVTGPLRITGGASLPSNVGLILTPDETGFVAVTQFGRRLSDSSPSVGSSVEFWPHTAMTTPVICTVKPGGGTGGTSPVQYRFTVDQAGDITLKSESSTTNARDRASIVSTWVDSTDASRKARLTLNAYDTAAREAIRVEGTGSAAAIGFLGAAAVARPTVTGSRGGNAALASLLTALASLGLLTDSTTA